MLEEKDDEKIRCCHHCMDKLLKIQQKLEEKDHVPDIVKLYEVKRAGIQVFRILPVIHFHLSSEVSCCSLKPCLPVRGWGCAWRRWMKRLQSTSEWQNRSSRLIKRILKTFFSEWFFLSWYFHSAGETTYNLDTAGGLRLEVQKYYELIDALRCTSP